MITKEYTIIEPFTREPWKALTFRQVKDISGNKSDNYVHTILKKFVSDDILNEKRVGNAILYSLAKNVFALNTAGLNHRIHSFTTYRYSNTKTFI